MTMDIQPVHECIGKIEKKNSVRYQFWLKLSLYIKSVKYNKAKENMKQKQP